jgi:radical SAM family protein
MSYLDLDYYRGRVEELHNSPYVDSPYMVSVETLALCNAACDFCPYPSLERKGIPMSDELLWKVLREFRDFPQGLPVIFTPSRVNEPFLDQRIFDICLWVNRELPHFSFNFFSNASPLTRANLLRLASIRNVNFLALSINDYRPETYEKVMRLPFRRTLERVAEVHEMKRTGELYFQVILSRVGDRSVHDEKFRAWAQQNFPLFSVWVTPRADWIGAVKTDVSPVPDVGCTQWFEQNLLADGKEAFCCMDSSGELCTANAASMHILEMYNQPAKRELRVNRVTRSALWPCNACPLQA